MKKNSFIFDVETSGLVAIKDRITCISLLNINHDTPISFFGENESLLLKQFWTATTDCENASAD